MFCFCFVCLFVVVVDFFGGLKLNKKLASPNALFFSRSLLTSKTVHMNKFIHYWGGGVKIKEIPCTPLIFSSLKNPQLFKLRVCFLLISVLHEFNIYINILSIIICHWLILIFFYHYTSIANQCFFFKVHIEKKK